MTAEEYLLNLYKPTEESLKAGLFRAIPSIETISKLMSDFAQLKCKEQRELCADNLKDEHFEFVDKYKEVGLQARYLALNSPEPKF